MVTTGILVLIYFSNLLNLTVYFLYTYGQFIILIIAFTWIMKKLGRPLFSQSWQLTKNNKKKYIKEFIEYSHPLLLHSIVGMVVGIIDRWMLQSFAGSIQQGFFGLSFKIGQVSSIFTVSMTPLLMREFSIAYSKKDFKLMSTLFKRYIPLIYMIAVYFSVFIAVQADKVILLFGGQKYEGALWSLIIFSFYPIHQSYGQLCGSVFFATGKTKLYRNIGVSVLSLSLIITYFLIAPQEKMGLNLGAIGLSIKMVAVNIISVNILLYYSTKIIKISFWNFLRHQFIGLIVMLILAYLTSVFVDSIINNFIISFIISGCIYTSLFAGIIYWFPAIVGLHKNDIYYLIDFIKNLKGK